MAHNLNFKQGKASFFSVKELAWHRLGLVLDNPPTIEEAIKYAQLDYEVKKGQCYVLFDKDTKVNKVEDRFVTYREDTKDIFEVVSSQYKVVQNEEAFSFFNPLLKQFDLTLETAGALGTGEEVFITAKTHSPIKIKGTDLVDNYLLLTNRHDGKGAVQIMFTPIRVVCNNTLCAALHKNTNKMSIKHYGNSEQQLKEAQRTLVNIFTDSISLEQYYNVLANQTIEDVNMKQYITTCLNLLTDETKLTEENQNKYNRDLVTLNDILEYYEIGPGQESIKGTAWGAYNSITGYLSNMKPYRNEESKFVSLNKDGEASKINQKALELAIAI